MAVVMVEYCERCGQPLVKSDSFMKDQVIQACKNCDVFRLESDVHWVTGSSEQVVSQLTTRLEDLERHQEAMHSEDTDPRWEQW